MNTEKDLARIKYETAHFGFPSESVILGVKEVVYDTITDVVSGFEVQLIKKSPGEADQIKAASGLLIHELTAKAQEPLEMLEKQIKECFAIPDHVLLPGDEIQQQQFTKEEEIALNIKLENLKFRYKRAVFMERMLRAERKVSNELSKAEFELLKLQKVHGTDSASAEATAKFLSQISSLNATKIRSIRNIESD